MKHDTRWPERWMNQQAFMWSSTCTSPAFTSQAMLCNPSLNYLSVLKEQLKDWRSHCICSFHCSALSFQLNLPWLKLKWLFGVFFLIKMAIHCARVCIKNYLICFWFYFIFNHLPSYLALEILKLLHLYFWCKNLPQIRQNELPSDCCIYITLVYAVTLIRGTGHL